MKCSGSVAFVDLGRAESVHAGPAAGVRAAAGSLLYRLGGRAAHELVNRSLQGTDGTLLAEVAVLGE
jgi:hypothetical protein